MWQVMKGLPLDPIANLGLGSKNGTFVPKDNRRKACFPLGGILHAGRNFSMFMSFQPRLIDKTKKDKTKFCSSRKIPPSEKQPWMASKYFGTEFCAPCVPIFALTQLQNFLVYTPVVWWDQWFIMETLIRLLWLAKPGLNEFQLENFVVVHERRSTADDVFQGVFALSIIKIQQTKLHSSVL